MVRLVSFQIILVFFSLIFFLASSSSILSSDPNIPLLALKIKPNLTTASSCPFRVQITTSCSSVSYTRDQISLSFGDAYGNQVYVPRIDNPSSRAFEACSTDTYDITGPCTYDVCYVYLYRRGSDRWKVNSVRISGPRIRTVTFNYKSWIPSDTWFGFNYCHGSSSQGYNKPQLSTLVMTLVALLFFYIGMVLVKHFNCILNTRVFFYCLLLLGIKPEDTKNKRVGGLYFFPTCL